MKQNKTRSSEHGYKEETVLPRNSFRLTVFRLCVWISLHDYVCVYMGDQRCQKRTSDPLQLAIDSYESTNVNAVSQTWVL